MRDRIGLAFFVFATVVSSLAAWERPGLLVWLSVSHNMILAILYSRRLPVVKYDRPGLWLGLLAALLPVTSSYPARMPWPLIIIGVLGYALIFWSLLSLGRRFGIAPADRGLVSSGPYCWIRHPMYLGELILRAALVSASPQILNALVLLLALAAIQVLRALREERILSGYAVYASQVPYRLLPGVW